MVEGEEMFEHFSVLNQETIEGLSIQPNGTYVDCTLGGAGHSKKIIEKLTEKGHLVALIRMKRLLNMLENYYPNTRIKLHSSTETSHS